MLTIPDNHMVNHVDLHELSCPYEIVGHFDVGLGRLRFATWMIVLCDVPSYVQWPLGGADTNAASTTKGVLWMRLNRPSRRSLMLPSAP